MCGWSILLFFRSFMLTNAGFRFDCLASREGVLSFLHPLLFKAILWLFLAGRVCKKKHWVTQPLKNWRFVCGYNHTACISILYAHQCRLRIRMWRLWRRHLKFSASSFMQAILNIIITGVIDCARYISKNWSGGPNLLLRRCTGASLVPKRQLALGRGDRPAASGWACHSTQTACWRNADAFLRQLVLRNTLCKGCLRAPPSPSCWVRGPNHETQLISLKCCHMGEILKALNDQHSHLAKICTKITLTNLQIEAMKPETN